MSSESQSPLSDIRTVLAIAGAMVSELGDQTPTFMLMRWAQGRIAKAIAQGATDAFPAVRLEAWDAAIAEAIGALKRGEVPEAVEALTLDLSPQDRQNDPPEAA